MDDPTLWAGGAALGALAIREAFAFALKFSKRNSNPEDSRRSLFPPRSESLQQQLKQTEEKIDNKLNDMAVQIRDLHDWHSKTDQDGVPVWYVRRSLEEAIDKLAENIQKQTDAFTRLVWEIQRQLDAQEKKSAQQARP